MEKAAAMAAANARGLMLLRDELGGWVGAMDRYSGKGEAERPFWLEAYNGNPYSVDRVDETRSVFVARLLYSILGGTQPDRLPKLLGDDNDGMAARFSFIFPRAIPLSRPRRPASNEHALTALRRIRGLVWTPPDPLVLPLTREAEEVHWQLRCRAKELEDETAGVLLSWVGKMPGLCLRLAMVLTHMEWSMTPSASEPVEIGPEAVDKAARFILDYLLPMARRVFKGAGLRSDDSDAATLARWLLRQSPVPRTVNVRDVHRRPGGPSVPSPERIGAALAALATLHWVRSLKSEGKGLARRQDWEVNPVLGRRP